MENENIKLKDILYGCCECGMYTYECEDFVNEDDDCSQAQLQLATPPPPAPQPSTSPYSFHHLALDRSLGHHLLHPHVQSVEE